LYDINQADHAGSHYYRHIGHSDFGATSLMLAIGSDVVHMSNAQQVEEISM
jgi:creatinine amidohydrolase/Fe(II)-dependent formamide hydrolase-like protein